MLTSWFSGAIHCDLDALGVDRHYVGLGVDADDEVEGLAPAAPADDPQVVELGHVVLHHLRVVPQLSAKVLVVPDPQVDHRPVLYVTQRDHFESRRQGFVRPPVAWKRCAKDVWGT